ncbi:MAG: hypothetical protein JWL62_1918 [Hyphomicrobiales bacterium]|nr:hypothetical protein [Hyphomicrobiales bacterium]
MAELDEQERLPAFCMLCVIPGLSLRQSGAGRADDRHAVVLIGQFAKEAQDAA